MAEMRRKSGQDDAELARLRTQVESLRAELDEARETLAAIQSGAVDALVIDTPQGQQVFSLQGVDRPYRELIEQMQEGAAILTLDGVIHYCNRALARMLGRAMETVVGSRLEQHLAAADRAALPALLGQARACSAHGEINLCGSDGRTRPVHLGLTLVRDDGHDSISMVATDLTERKHQEAKILQLNQDLEHRVTQRTAELQNANLELASEAALRRRTAAAAEQQRQLLAVTLASIGDAVISTDAQGRVSFLNGEAERLTGWRGAEALGQPLPTVFNIINEETRQAVENPVDKVLRLGTVVGLANHSVVIARDGSETPIDDSAALIRQNDGTSCGVVLVFRDFSTQKAAEKALRDSEARFRTMADAIPQLAWTANADGYVNWYNQRWYEYTGTTPQRMEGWGWQSVHDPAVLPQVVARWRESLASGAPLEMEFPLRRADGQFRTFLTRVMPLQDGEGRVVQWFATSTDIQQMKQAEAALRESEERFRTLFMSVSEDFYVAEILYDEAGKPCDYRYVDVNPAFQQMLDLPREQIIGKRYKEIVAPEQAAEWLETFVQVAQTGRAAGVSFYSPAFRRHFGVVAFRPAAGQFAVLVTDITARKLAEEALQLSETRERQRAAELATLLEAVPTPVIIVHDADGQHMTANRAAEQLLRVGQGAEVSLSAPAAIKPQHFRPMKDGRELTLAELPAQRAARGEAVHGFEFSLVFADGTVREVVADGTPLLDEQGRPRGAVHTLVDITERKRIEDALKAASQAKDNFLAALSHELRNPLNPVLATATMLRDNGKFDADTHEQLDVICRNAAMEARLIDDLLDVTRIERGKIELERRPIQICSVIHRAIEVCIGELKAKGLQFSFENPGGPYAVNVDAARMQQVFWNLIRNAVKFTPQGGEVRVRRYLDGDGWVAVEVQDNGEGMEPGDLQRIFNAFEQTSRDITRQFGGLGLGLTISKGLVEMHGGTIQAHSAGKGKGSTFTVRLPLLSGAAKMSAAAPPQAPPARAAARPLRILLVEDHADTARVMRRLLFVKGHQVEIALTVAAALELAAKQPFDLLLSDLGLPDGNGLDLMMALRAKGLTMPGIALSGFGQEGDMEQSRKAGFAAHMVKPVSLPLLEETIAKIVSGGGG